MVPLYLYIGSLRYLNQDPQVISGSISSPRLICIMKHHILRMSRDTNPHQSLPTDEIGANPKTRRSDMFAKRTLENEMEYCTLYALKYTFLGLATLYLSV